jgi:5-formyltetrahydrofolate cyclo-ligase
MNPKFIQFNQFNKNNNVLSPQHKPLKPSSKQPLRHLLLSHRHTISSLQKNVRQTIGIQAFIQRLRENYSNICIALYSSHAGEPNILSLASDLYLDGNTNQYTFALPVVLNKNEPLKFAKYVVGNRLVSGAYGILVPEVIEWVTPNLILMPCVGYQQTAQGLYRLGYGGGFYDRTLMQLHSEPAFIGSMAVAWRDTACCFDIQVFDIAADGLLLI